MKDNDKGKQQNENGLQDEVSLNCEVEALEKRLRWAQESQELAVRVLALSSRNPVALVREANFPETTGRR